MNLASVDLNLLVAFDALLSERSVTRAAHRLGVTQPAMSNTLRRLRALLDDPVLTRSPTGMVPTPHALALAEPVRQALARIAEALEAPRDFAPATARLAFRLATTDYAAMVLLPPLLTRLAEEAPGVDLQVRGFSDGTTVSELVSGAFDLVVGFVGEAPENVYRQALFQEEFVCAVRADHPVVRDALDLDTYCALAHLQINPRGRAGGFVDDLLAARGKARRVAVSTPHFLLAPQIVSRTDLVVTLAGRVARTYGDALRLRLFPPPLELPGFQVTQLWHERTHREPAHRWLRQVFSEIARTV